jgi:hypothetical protein
VDTDIPRVPKALGPIGRIVAVGLIRDRLHGRVGLARLGAYRQSGPPPARREATLSGNTLRPIRSNGTLTNSGTVFPL